MVVNFLPCVAFAGVVSPAVSLTVISVSLAIAVAASVIFGRDRREQAPETI